MINPILWSSMDKKGTIWEALSHEYSMIDHTHRRYEKEKENEHEDPTYGTRIIWTQFFKERTVFKEKLVMNYKTN